MGGSNFLFSFSLSVLLGDLFSLSFFCSLLAFGSRGLTPQRRCGGHVHGLATVEVEDFLDGYLHVAARGAVKRENGISARRDRTGASGPHYAGSPVDGHTGCGDLPASLPTGFLSCTWLEAAQCGVAPEERVGHPARAVLTLYYIRTIVRLVPPQTIVLTRLTLLTESGRLPVFVGSCP